MLSIVIPAYNEEENVNLLYDKLEKVLRNLDGKKEIIFVDDGSNDRTFKFLKQISARDKSVRVIRFTRNFGQSAAISAGFKECKGDVVVTLDADLQNDPEDIPKLLKKLDEGFDVVCGWRRKRKDPFFSKKIPSLFSNWLASKMTGLKVHDSGCTLRAYRKPVVKELNLYGEMHRFIPALAMLNGYSVAEVEVKHNPRKFGKTKYKMLRLFKGLSDLITIAFIERYGARPGHIFTSFGVSISAIGSVALLYLLVDGLLHWVNIMRPAFYISILLVMAGIQFITIGILSEMITRVRYEVSGRKFFNIREKIN